MKILIDFTELYYFHHYSVGDQTMTLFLTEISHYKKHKLNQVENLLKAKLLIVDNE
jgi:hypothetical protein